MPWWQWMLVYKNSMPLSSRASRWPMEMPLMSAHMAVLGWKPWARSRPQASPRRRWSTWLSTRSQKLR